MNKQIPKEWTDWARGSVVNLKDGGVLAMPLKGVYFVWDENEKTLTSIIEHPEYKGCDTDVLNREVYGKIGIKVKRSPDVATDPEEALKLLVKIEQCGTIIIDKSIREAFANNQKELVDDPRVLQKLQNQISSLFEMRAVQDGQHRMLIPKPSRN